MDLHSDNFASVRLGEKVGAEFKVTAGVRQGCVIAPTLFNVFIDMVVKHAMHGMPEQGGMCVRVHQQPRVTGDEGSIEHIIMLMYADDVVLMAHDIEVLVEMLKVHLDRVATQFGMKVNAAKTEVQVLGGTPPVIPQI